MDSAITQIVEEESKRWGGWLGPWGIFYSDPRFRVFIAEESQDEHHFSQSEGTED